MLHSNGQKTCFECQEANATVYIRHVSKINKLLLPSQVEFMDFIMFHGVSELAKSLRSIHDLLLYHSNVEIGNNEKSALFDLKILWESFEPNLCIDIID